MAIRRWYVMMAVICGLGAAPAWAQDDSSSELPATADVNLEALGFPDDGDEAVDEIPLDGTTSEPVAAVEPIVPGDQMRALRTVEESVHALKERVFRSKATLQLLKELVVEGGSMGSRVAVWHVNKFGAAYALESVQYFLDGKNIYSKVDPSGALGDLKEIKVREQTVAPGPHTLHVNLVMRGSGFGIFSYLKTYQFKVQSSYSFDVADGELTTLRVIANTKGGVRRAFVDRPNLQYEERSEALDAE